MGLRSGFGLRHLRFPQQRNTSVSAGYGGTNRTNKVAQGSTATRRWLSDRADVRVGAIDGAGFNLDYLPSGARCDVSPASAIRL